MAKTIKNIKNEFNLKLFTLTLWLIEQKEGVGGSKKCTPPPHIAPVFKNSPEDYILETF